MRPITLMFLLVLATSCQAKPNWRKVGQIALYGAAAGASIAATYHGHECRVRNGVEPCTAHYGSFAATEGVRQGFTGTTISLSWWGHKHGLKEWFVPAASSAAFNSWWAVHESRIHQKDVT